MLSSLRGRFALILIVVAISGWQLYSKGLKQGLDLQGGMHLVLEVDDPDSTLTTAARADGRTPAQLAPVGSRPRRALLAAEAEWRDREGERVLRPVLEHQGVLDNDGNLYRYLSYL